MQIWNCGNFMTIEDAEKEVGIAPIGYLKS